MKGFTLIELLVSVAIFTIVMVIGLGALLSMSAADRKAQSLQSVINNLNFALDSMSRSIRTGTNYECITNQGTQLPIAGCQAGVLCTSVPAPNDCTVGSGGGTSLAFLDVTPRVVVYRFNASCTANNTGCIERSLDGGNTFTAFTAPEVVITAMTFYVLGSELGSAGDTLQPEVIVTLHGYVQVTETQKTAFDVQTSITERLYDQ